MTNWKNKIASILQTSTTPLPSLHLAKIALIQDLGFHKGYQSWLTILTEHPILSKTVNAYFKQEKNTYHLYSQQEQLLLVASQRKDMISIERWITELHEQQNFSKKTIYEILLCLHLFLNSTSQYGEVYADWLADHILDRFGAWGKNNPILPNEPLL